VSVDTGSASGKLPHALEPIGQQFSGTDKDSAVRQRMLAFTAGTDHLPVGAFPKSYKAAVVAERAIWKAAQKTDIHNRPANLQNGHQILVDFLEKFPAS
jgi:hypothetical protein